MNKIFATGLLCTLAVIPVSFSMYHNGAQDAARALSLGEGPKFAFKMYSIPDMISLCEEAQRAEDSTGVNLGFKNDNGTRKPMLRATITPFVVDPNAFNCNEVNASYLNDILNFVNTFTVVYFALKDLTLKTAYLQGSQLSLYPALQNLYNNMKNKGLRAFRDFLGNPEATFEDFYGKGDAILQDAAQCLISTIQNSVYNQPRFLQNAETDRRLNAQL